MTVAGTCAHFCPTREQLERQRNRQVDPLFEREVLVKRYNRPAAGKVAERPEDVRPPQVLLDCVEYLLSETLKLATFPKCYPFVWDRLWAVRQDITFQQSACAVSRRVLARCVKFYTVSRVLCSGGDVPLSVFDPKVNDTHLADTLGKLIRIYEELEIEDEDRPQMEALLLLLNLQTPRIVCRAFTLPAKIRQHMRDALLLAKAYHSSNSFRFLRLSDNVDILQFCIVSRSLNAVRLELLQTLNTAFSSKTCAFPLSELSAWLNCGETECRTLLELSGLPPDDNANVHFLKTNPNVKFSDSKTPAAPFIDASRQDQILEALPAILLL